MKKFQLLLLLMGVTFAISSCKTKGCTDPYAENYNEEAEKDDESCTYLSDRLLGTYNVNQECDYGGESTYTMNVIEGENKGEVILQGLEGEHDIKATISGTNFTFKEDKAGITFEGTGYKVGDNQITINMEVCETFYYPCSDPELCTLTCTK